MRLFDYFSGAKGQRRHFWVLLVMIILSGTFCALRILWRLFPEAGMIANSQCKNPLASWDGKLMNYQVWTNAFENKPNKMFVRKNIDNSSYDRRLLRGDEEWVVDDAKALSIRQQLLERELSGDVVVTKPLEHLHRRKRPVILWGSHHKTGTYLAQKIFSLICSRMDWCCQFLQTRDSVHSVKDMLTTENVDVLGHSQWVWNPEELGVPYKFVHFYRKPLKKVISGYRYHMDGVEPWTTRPLHYDLLCSSGVYEQSEKYNKLITHFEAAGLSHLVAHTKAVEHMVLKRSQVIDHCRGAYLCESCCRREHEAEYAITSTVDPAVEIAWRKFMHKEHNCDGSTGQGTKEDGSPCHHTRVLALRPSIEYHFICKTLGKVNISLMDALLQSEQSEGLAIEASLDFFENLRMARIYNHTFHDPDSLNIDLDLYMGNFAVTTRRLLKHLDLGLSNDEIERLVTDIGFFDISASTIYRWSMSNSFVNHINTKRPSVSQNFDYIIRSNQELMKAYDPILSLMTPH